MKGLTRRRMLTNSVLAAFFGGVGAGGARSASAASDGPLPWRNWSGGLVSHPRGRFAAASESELADFLSNTTGPVRPVGSGHSFTPLVPTDGHLVIIDQIAGLINHDADALQATFGAGTRLGDMGAPLEAIGQAMFNLPDIDRQTLAGATATATHGTGIEFGCLSDYVTALRLATPGGELIDVSREATPDLFDAARVSVGALGVVTRMTMQNRPSYRLIQKSWTQKTEEVLESFGESAAQHRHFEMFPYTHSDFAGVLATDESDAPTNNPPPSPEEGAAFAELIAQVSQVPPRDRLPMINSIMGQGEPSERVDVSYKILSNERHNRFNEMEYSVPMDAGAACLREILRTIIDKEIDVVFPLEYRYVRRDDTWLSMSSGEEDHAAISIHRTAGEDFRPYFDLIEPIFWKYEGRPHWGKVHSLGAAELTKLYPRFKDFQEIRESLDPKGRMLNDHLKKLFGVPA